MWADATPWLYLDWGEGAFDWGWMYSGIYFCPGFAEGGSSGASGSSGGGPGGIDARIIQKLWQAYRFAEFLLNHNQDCDILLGQGSTASGATVTAAQVLTDLMNDSTYGSIAPGPITIPGLPQNSVVNAATTSLTIAFPSGATQNGADITINDLAGDYVTGTGGILAQTETLLHELGHAMNFIFGSGTSGIALDGSSVPNGFVISQGDTQLVDAACIKGFVPPAPVLLPRPDTAMRYESIRLLAAAALACMGPVQARSGSGAPGPPVVTVCDLMRTPLEYDGRLIQVRGRLSGTDEGEWLFGDGCPGALVTDGHVWPTAIWLTAPDHRGVLHAPDFKLDEDSGRRFNRSYKRLRRRLPEQCIVSTLTGLFETRRDWSQFKRAYPSGTWAFTGFGHLGEAPGQLVIKSEDEVAVVPNCSAGRKPRGH